MKKEIISTLVLSAILFVVSSCEEKEPYDELTTSKIGINVSLEDFKSNTDNNKKSRASDIASDNLDEFTLTSFIDGRTNYINGVKYTKQGTAWTTSSGDFYWPKDKELFFYAYSPSTASGTCIINKNTQVISNYTSDGTKDLVFAKTTVNTSSSTDLNLNFQHALSKITVAVKNRNNDYNVTLGQVTLNNIAKQGSFTFPSPLGEEASWNLVNQTEQILLYSPTDYLKVGKYEQNLCSKYIIPQQLTKSAIASERSCICMNIQVTATDGSTLYNGTAYVGLGSNFEMGKQYNIVLDFSNGVGQDAYGNVIKINTLNGIYNSNSIIVAPSVNRNYYGLDITRANTFWSNPDVGDANNVIDANTEWTAEVIWQDIPNRVINFCDRDGQIVSTDTYDGKGTSPIYIKVNDTQKGNVVVGIKKRGAGSDSYLWSWHLWLTDEPKEIAGFMDRNLGATSENPIDAFKTFGLYYQFGRKDPVIDEYYDINGTASSNQENYTGSYATFAQTVKSPNHFYGFSQDKWALQNNYTSNNWYDITNSTGKTYFDPCPTGWRIPKYTELNIFTESSFPKDETYNGRTYNGNWFPANNYAYPSTELWSDQTFKGMGFSYGDHINGIGRYNFVHYVTSAKIQIRCIRE